MWDEIPTFDREKFDYIRRQIASGRRDADIPFLREVRALHFRRYSKETPSHA